MKQVLVETSARHIHLSREAVDALFGEGYELTNKKDLSQPGQFACAEKLEVVGPKGKLKASILGPTRNASQVELSLTDARSIGAVSHRRTGAAHIITPKVCICVGLMRYNFCGNDDIKHYVLMISTPLA